jgi:hypothetical protein
MRANLLRSLLFLFIATSLVYCKKQTEEFQSASLSDYLPLQEGKYIIYRTDSTVFTNFGRNVEIHSYQEKQVIDAQVTDAMGRAAYRVYVYLSDTTGTQSWTPAGSYMIIPGKNIIEVLENNLRFEKLALPVKQDFSWKGNSYLPFQPYNSLYSFSNDDNMGNWIYSYGNTDTTLNLYGQAISHVAVVNMINDQNLPDTLTLSGNQLSIPANMNNVWIRGTSPDTVTLKPVTNSPFSNLNIYNRTNSVLTLNNISIPASGNRSYTFTNGNWTFGDRDNSGNVKDTITYDDPYGYVNYATDLYAKNIGLVSQQFTMWEYQPNSGGQSGGYKVGFGIKRTMLNHN